VFNVFLHLCCTCSATNNFDDSFIVGHGGFGNVYKGFIAEINFEIGYCNDNNEKILVYDYMANGTLCHHLCNTERTPLTDLLLDEEYVAKVSDFGLSKMSRINMENVPLTTMWCCSKCRFTRPTVNSKVEYSQIDLVDWAQKCVEHEKNCIHENGCERPSMNGVARTLEFALQLQEFKDAEEIRQASDRA
ncbi:hypothetical protein Golob_027662, partial [Gossypium lobatum]|nr:hypothetical protein [Gossypium lobatum]